MYISPKLWLIFGFKVKRHFNDDLISSYVKEKHKKSGSFAIIDRV